MIAYKKFKELFEVLDSNRGPEIEITFKNRKDSYVLIKFNEKITFGNSEQVFDYKDIDELYNSKTVDSIILKEEWNNIEDILIDMTFSVKEDKVKIKEIYGVEI